MNTSSAVIVLTPLILLVAAVCPGSAQEGWQADPETVERLSAGRPEFNYHEERVPPYSLPDVLVSASGERVDSPAAWESRRQEILEQFRDEVYGRRPDAPERLEFEVVEEDRSALDGRATFRRVAIHSGVADREHTFELLLFLPNSPLGRSPVFLLLNNRPPTNTDPGRGERSQFWPVEEVIARGFGIAAIQNNALAPDDSASYRDGVINLFSGPGAEGERPANAWAALAAWGWGASRVMDYLETDMGVDADRVAVVGHSRGGKAALWVGAEDPRFALAISNESGAGGAALSRRRYGETVERITSSFPHWFAPRFSSYADREDELPIDQHMLVALMAPRAVYVASADEDLWADPRGEFLSLVHASPVFDLGGGETMAAVEMPPLEHPVHAGSMGYHVRRGGHNLTLYDWMRFVDFAEHLWR